MNINSLKNKNFGLFRAGYIYTLVCPDTNLVRYVGKTFCPKDRFYSHLSVNNKEKTKKANWVRSLLKNGKKPIIEIIDECDEFNWEDKEISYIKLYKSIGAKLLNMTNGGDCGAFNYKFTKEQKEKVRNGLKGIPKSKEHIENAKNALKIKFETDSEYREKMISKARTALNNLTDEQKEKSLINRKKAKLRKKIKDMNIKLCDFYKYKSQLDSKQIRKTELARIFNCSRNSVYLAYKLYIK